MYRIQPEPHHHQNILSYKSTSRRSASGPYKKFGYIYICLLSTPLYATNRLDKFVCVICVRLFVHLYERVVWGKHRLPPNTQTLPSNSLPFLFTLVYVSIIIIKRKDFSSVSYSSQLQYTCMTFVCQGFPIRIFSVFFFFFFFLF